MAPALGLSPFLWGEGNLLFVPAEGLTEMLRALCESLPLEVRAPMRAPEYQMDCRDVPDAASVIEEEVGHQLAMSRELSVLAEKANARLAVADLWCSLLAPNGWLSVPPIEAAQLFGVDQKLFSEALGVVQRTVEPAGLFARDAAECLLLQLDAAGGRGCDAGLLLTEGRLSLESGPGALEDFRAARGWTSERLRAAMGVLRRLDPSPGRGLSAAVPVCPELDFFHAPNQQGGGAPRCRLAREYLPELSLVSEDLQATLASGQWARARSLLLRLAARYRALLRIGIFAAHAQAAYLNSPGPAAGALAPLGLKEIAAVTGLHVSTVSRCMTHTWARTPFGMMRLSRLLSRSIHGLPYAELEQIISRASIEGTSDAALSRETGIPRRTIAYHRRRLGIPSCRARSAR